MVHLSEGQNSIKYDVVSLIHTNGEGSRMLNSVVCDISENLFLRKSLQNLLKRVNQWFFEIPWSVNNVEI